MLSGAGSHTLGNVVWLDSHPQAEFPVPGSNLTALADALGKTAGGYEHGDVPGAVRIALEQLAKGRGVKELCLVSDFQASAWKDAELRLPPNVRVLKVPVAGAEAANAAVTSLSLDPSQPVAGAEARVVARVRNFSAAPLRTTAYLAFGEARDTRPVEVAPWGGDRGVFPRGVRHARLGAGYGVPGGGQLPC
jgi:hypothetical protein